MKKWRIIIITLLIIILLSGVLMVALFGSADRTLTGLTTAEIETNPMFNAYLSSDGTLWVQQRLGDVSAMTDKTAANLSGNVNEMYTSGVYDGRYFGTRQLCDGVLKFVDSVEGIYILKTTGLLYLHPYLSGIGKGDEAVMTLIAENVKDISSQNGEIFFELSNGNLISRQSSIQEGAEVFIDETGKENAVVAKNCKDIGMLIYVSEQGELFVKGANSYGVFGNGAYDETPFSDYVLGKAAEPTDYNIKNYTMAFNRVNEAYGLITNIYAIREDNTLWAWGDNEFGLVGNGTQGDGLAETRDVVTIPVKILDNVKKLVSADSRLAVDENNTLTAGPDAVFALTYDGDVYAWGYNTYGLIGDGMQAADGEELIVNAPKKILSGVSNIISSRTAIFALKNDGSVYGWGCSANGDTGTGKYNKNGFSGTLLKEDFVSKPMKIIDGIVLISETSKGTMAAIKKDGFIVMWGKNPFMLVLPDTASATASGRQAVAIQDKPAVNPFIKCTISKDGEIIFEKGDE